MTAGVGKLIYGKENSDQQELVEKFFLLSPSTMHSVKTQFI